MTTITLGSNTKVGSFQYYSTSSNRPVVQYIYPKDINGDGVDEIFFAGFETQPNTPNDYTNTSIHIFGWQNGKLQEITNQWLPNNTNQVEGVGDIAFGDFNGDGLIDAYISGNADMEHTINAYALMNKGNSFEKINLGPTKWEHGVAVGDINLDGFSDIVVAGYIHPSIFLLGGANGLTRYSVSDDHPTLFNSWETNGSGVAIADFIGDGGVSIVVVDSAPSNGPNDTRLLSVVKDAQGTPIGFKYIATLPIPRLELPKYNNIANGQYDNSHDVRAEPFDFNQDGLVDVIVFSRAGWNGYEWPTISEIQFLKNLGGGLFEDVTDTVVVGYDSNSGIAYNPIIADFNRDGLLDLYSSEVGWEGPNSSTALLLQKANGTFVETGRKQISSLLDTWGGISNIAKGPDGEYFIVSTSHDAYGPTNNLITSVFSSKITFRENKAPTLSKPVADLNANEGKTISYSIGAAFTDPDKSDVLSYTVTLEDGSSLPEWLSFNASTKKLTGSLPYNADNNLNIKVTATDLDGLSISDSFSINIKNVINIKGTSKADVIKAGAGNDTINGGLGSDTLTGGLGNDTFVFNTKLGPSNIDTITDFTSGDKIALAGSIFSKLKGDKDLSDNFALDSATTDKHFLIYKTDTGQLYYDVDGNATNSSAIEIAIIGIDSNSALKTSDIVII
jgi:Ca2+-binding RTX toxin-like protein